MSAVLTPGASADNSQTQETALLDQIVEQSKVAKSSTEHERAKDLISELVSQVLEGTVVVSNNLAATIDARVAELDKLISEQLSTIMHADTIFVLEKGRVVETGSHDALVAQKGLYYAMWRQQIGERPVPSEAVQASEG